MKSVDVDNFLFLSKMKNKVTFWRIFSVCLLFALIPLLFYNKIKCSEKKENDYIAKVKINGEIWNDSFDEERLDELKKDSSVKAIILEIDSPGGEVVSSEILYSFFKEISKEKPVVATIKSLGASGAYMVALASEYIVAYNTSLIGSIGVFSQSTNVSDLLDRFGVNVKMYKSSKLKASPNMYEKTDEEVDSVMEEEINEVYNYFLDVFVENRKLSRKDALDIANGQIYVGRQALNFKLIDKIGNTKDLLDYLEKKGIETKKVSDYDITRYYGGKISKFIKNFNSRKVSYSKKLLFLYN